MLKKTVITICFIGCLSGLCIIRRYLHPATTDLSTNWNNIPKDTTQRQYTTLITGLDDVTAIQYVNFQKIIYTQRDGYIGAIVHGKKEEKPIAMINNLQTEQGAALLGLVVDPDYNTNKNIYVCYTYINDNTLFAKVEKIQEQNSTGGRTIVIDKLPAAPDHAGCAIAIGPDKKLYISIGDALQGEKAQYPDYYNGKIIRINTDGAFPTDNPYPKSAIWSIGHRNVVGIARDSKNTMYAVEKGPEIVDGQPGGDELNTIIPKGNYGWNIISHEQTQTGFVSPMIIYTPAIYPQSLAIDNRQGIDTIVIGSDYGLLHIQKKGEEIQQIWIYDKKIGALTIGENGSIYAADKNSIIKIDPK